MNAQIEYRQVQLAMALGMRTIGELMAFLKSNKTSKIIKDVKKHNVKKYNFKQLKGGWI